MMANTTLWRRQDGRSRNVRMPSTTWQRLFLLTHDRPQAIQTMLEWIGLRIGLPSSEHHTVHHTIRAAGEVLDWILRSPKHLDKVKRAYALAIDKGVSSDLFDARRVRREARGRSRVIFELEASEHNDGDVVPKFSLQMPRIEMMIAGGGDHGEFRPCQGQAVPENEITPSDLGLANTTCGAVIGKDRLLCEKCSKNINPLSVCYTRTLSGSIPTLAQVIGSKGRRDRIRSAAQWSAGPHRGEIDWEWVAKIASSPANTTET